MESKINPVGRLQARQQHDLTPNGPRGGDRFFMGGSIPVARDKDILRSNGSGGKSVGTVKYQLAERRYGREEMLALFDLSNSAPGDLREHSIFIEGCLSPVSFMPMTEEEEVLSLQNVNSYGYKPYSRGGIARGGLRGDFVGRGRGRGRDEEGRLRSRDSWDDRPKVHDYSAQGYGNNDEIHSATHRTDFFSPSSSSSSHHHGIPYNRSNSNESWRSRGHQHQESEDHRRDRWGTTSSKNWREGKGEPRPQEETPTPKAAAARDHQQLDFRRSKSLYEDEEASQKVPEWSTVDKEDLGMEGSFDSSGAFTTSKQQDDSKKKKSDDSVAGNSKTSCDASRNPQESKKPVELEKIPEVPNESIATQSSSPGRREKEEEDKKSSHSAPVVGMVQPKVEVTRSTKPEENALSINLKIASTDSPCVSLAKPMETNVMVVGQTSVHSPLGLSRLTPDPNLLLPLLQKQPFLYERNAWFYVDPQGATQGPFRDADMSEWYYQGYFDTTLMLKAGISGEFMTLGAFSAKVGSLPFVPQRQVASQPLQNVSPSHGLSQIPLPILPNIQHPVSTLRSDVLQPNLYYPQPPIIPQHQNQLHHQMQTTESLSSSFLPAMPNLGPTNMSNSLFQSANVHMSSINGDVPIKTAWNQQVFQNNSMGEGVFNSGVSQNPGALWNAGLLPSDNIPVGMSQLIPDGMMAGSVDRKPFPTVNPDQASQQSRQPKSGADYNPVPLVPDLDSEAKRRSCMEREQARLVEELKKKKQEEEEEEEEKRQQEELKRRLEEEQEKIQNEMMMEKMRIAEETKVSEDPEKPRAPEGMKSDAIAYEVEEEGEEFRPVEETKKTKESKKRKEANKRQQEEAKKQQEEQRRAEEARRLEVQRKAEELKKRAEEEKKKAEEEKARRFKESAEEAKRKEMEELNHRKLMATKNAWSTGQSSASAKAGIQTLTEIQSIEQTQMLQQLQLNEKKAADQQKQTTSVARTTGGIWKSPAVPSSTPKSLLDIQLEQASQLEVPVKVQNAVPVKVPSQTQAKVQPQKPQPPKVVDVATKMSEVGKEAPWESVSAPTHKKQQKTLALDNNQFPALASSKSSSLVKKLPVKLSGKTRDEVAAQKVFESAKPKDELTEWCEKTLAGLKTDVDIPTLVDLLKALDNSSEVVDYIHCYLGDSKQVKEFAKHFIEKSHSLSQNNAWSVVGRQGNTNSNKPNDKTSSDKTNAKKGKKKQQKVDANFLLGFTVHADPDRTNVGEIDSIPPAGLRK